MTIAVSYMGTKRSLAPVVADIISASRGGPLLDVFSGLCSVAECVAPHRQTWTNDLQYFASNVALAHLCSQTDPVSRMEAFALLSKGFSQKVQSRTKLAAKRVTAEMAALRDLDAAKLATEYAEWDAEGPLPGGHGETGEPTLFQDAFAGSYFGLLQSIEIDALRSTIDDLFLEEIIDVDQKRWMILALSVALSKCSNSTGHFAQPLKPKKSNISRFSNQRQKSVKGIFFESIDILMPVGSRDWRLGNRSFRGEANTILSGLSDAFDEVPSVVYADPPYTSDQYSRYYHIYETLFLYDYPTAEGIGRYRPDRAVSDFCLASRVSDAFDRLIGNCKSISADLVISYPADGLLKNSREVIPEKIRSIYGTEPEVIELNYKHSTMGGSKGPGKKDVTEVIYRAHS